MRCPRSVVLALLAAFAAKASVPAPALVSHEHDHGERPHVHAEDLPPHHHDHEEHSHHTAAPSEGVLGAAPWQHTHWQLPYLRMEPAAGAAVLRAYALRRLVAAPPVDPPASPAPPFRSRGPPSFERS